MAEIIQQSQQVGRVRSKKSSTRIDMTPMVDLAFLLLTFFILTTQLMKSHVMELNVPEKPDDRSKPVEVNSKQVLTLMLDGDNKIYWKAGNGNFALTDYSPKGLRNILLEQNRQIKNMIILIKPSDHAAYQNIVDIMDEMFITEMKKYYLIDFTTDDQKALNEAKALSFVGTNEPFK